MSDDIRTESEIIISALYTYETEGYATEGERDQALMYVNDLQRQNAAMRAALEKFADPGNWGYGYKPGQHEWIGDGSPTELAQKALQERG